MEWIEAEFNHNEMLYIAIDRTQWGLINLRLKKSTYVEVEKETWIALKNLGLEPRISLYY